MTQPDTHNSKTVTVTKLDPSYEVAYSSISSEHDGILYYDKNNRQIPLIDIEEPYTPKYDAERSRIDHWFFKSETKLYRDIYTEIAAYRSRNWFHHVLQIKFYMTFDKYLGRFL